jgi:hypothetical protein
MQGITEEYYLQGDDMVKRGMVVPEMMNRHSSTPRQETTVRWESVRSLVTRCHAEIIHQICYNAIFRTLYGTLVTIRSHYYVVKQCMVIV